MWGRAGWSCGENVEGGGVRIEGEVEVGGVMGRV